jgi:hypothetical protein
MALLYCSFDFLFCLRWPFFITLMYKLDRNVHVSHPLSLYQRGKTQIVSACQTFSVASLSCAHPTFLSSANLLFPSRPQTGPYCSWSNLSGQGQFFPSIFWVGGWGDRRRSSINFILIEDAIRSGGYLKCSLSGYSIDGGRDTTDNPIVFYGIFIYRFLLALGMNVVQKLLTQGNRLKPIN